MGACVVAVLFGMAFPGSDALGSRRSSRSSSGYVLIYSGSAVCEGCAEAVGDVVVAAGFPVRYAGRPAKVPSLLASAFVVPETDDNIEPMRRSFNRNVRPALLRFLRGGGRYWGLCGGVFLTVQHYWATETQYVSALGIVPANAETYSDDDSPHIEKVRWYGRLRRMYYEGGPYFMPRRHAQIKVLASYSDGSIAAFAYHYGKGKVILTGPHPEATSGWLTEDGIDPTGWKSTFPLAMAMLSNLPS